jgi:hypothetical protein
MRNNKMSASLNSWGQENDLEEEEDSNDISQGNIEKDIRKVLKIVEIAKKNRAEAYAFSPKSLKKENKIKSAKKELAGLIAQSLEWNRENMVINRQALKKEIRIVEKKMKQEAPFLPKTRLFKKPSESQKQNVTSLLKKLDTDNSSGSILKSLKDFNSKAEEEIKLLTKELSADKYNYEM